jgi:predicted peptidase
MKRCAWLMSLLGLAGCATTGTPPLTFKSSLTDRLSTGFLNKTIQVEGQPFRYVVYVPYEYDETASWPMIVFLHGAGERGNDGLIQTEVGIGTALRRYTGRYPAIVLMPQCPDGAFFDQILPAMDKAMAQTREEYNIDDKRIYLTGLSMGGYGTWLWGALRTDLFAALMPICGGGDIEKILRLADRKAGYDFPPLEERVKALATIPIWAFHGADDDVVSPEESRQMVERVRAAGGDIQYTEFPETGHNSWDQAYAHRKAAQWLFNQSKK